MRNGVETIPSTIRQNYHLDKLPRSKQRGKFFFGSKIAELNFRKLFTFLKGWGTMHKIRISLNTNQKYAYDSKLLNMLMTNLL